MNAITKLTATTLLTAGVALSSTSAFALSPYQADYSFSRGNTTVGTASRILTKSGQNWKYTFSAKVPIAGSAAEVSQFNIKNNQVQSAAFSRVTKLLGKSRTLSLAFQPDAKKIAVKNKGKTSNITWRNGVLDELNAEIQLRLDLQNKGLKSSYYIADRKNVDRRKFVQEGKERIQTKAGSYDTIKLRLKHDGSDKSTMFWLAPQLDYLPVKITHTDEKNSYGLVLTKYSKR